MDLFMTIFGYVGTALVLTSMLMTSVMKLRILNTIGSVISGLYAVYTGTWPVVILNLGLVIINVVQMIRLIKTKVAFRHVQAGAQDTLLNLFLEANKEDIGKYIPNYTYTPGENTQVHMVFDGMEAVGVLIGTAEENTFHAELDYVTPKYRDCSVARFLFDELKQAGFGAVCQNEGAPLHKQYLEKMGFVPQNGTYTKSL